MTVKAVILDIEGTLIDDDGDLVEGVPDAIEELRELEQIIVLASNNASSIERANKLGIQGDLELTSREVGKKKGSPQWIKKIRAELGLQTNELVYVGDSQFDAWTAINSRVVYFNAAWSSPDFEYGIPLKRPASLPLAVRHFFMKEHLWYWDTTLQDRRRRPSTTKAMIDGYGAGIPELKKDIISVFKKGGRAKVGPTTLTMFMMMHLLGSIYLDGLYRTADVWTVYPGSGGGPHAAIGPFVDISAKLFHDSYRDDLLIRHTRAKDSGVRRGVDGVDVDFLNQINTTQLGGRSIEGKCVLVIDDFTTAGYSFECARNLLLEAGAAEVISVALGKYRYQQCTEAPRPGYHWDAYQTTAHDARAFLESTENGTTNDDALRVIRDSYEEMKNVQ